MKKDFRNRSISGLLALIMLFAALLTPVFAADQAQPKRVVRVGWYESPFNKTDDFGRRSGYAYEYQQKIAAYTGWKYEYVTGSWSDLMQMLVEGKIDLMSDVSYTEERAESMLFSSLPMGAETYYIYVSPGEEEIRFDNLSALNGKKVGINKGSVQVGFFKSWAEENGIEAEVIEVSSSVEETLNRLQRGEYDAIVMLDGYFALEQAVPLCSVGASDFYFAVNNSYPEIVNELNDAMKRIQTDDPNFNQKLNSKYIKVSGSNYYVDAGEKEWLAEHNYTVRVGYQDNYLAFCAKDPETNELTGALRDYLKVAEKSFANASLKFEAVCYPTASAAMEAVRNGEVDCMFPANLTDYDGEEQGFLMTDTIMRTDISAIVLESVKDSFANKEHIIVAVNAGNPNYNMFLIDNFPDWRPIVFTDTPECLKAISEGKADCLLMSNFRYNNISKLCTKYGLTSVSTGVEIDYSFAVRRDNSQLYSMLNRINVAVPTSTVEAALSYYFVEDAKLSFGEMIKQNFSVVIIPLIAIIFLLLTLLIYYVRARKKADTSQKLISATQTDPLTGLYNKNYFYEYAAQMHRDDPKMKMDVIVLNIEQFHSVNAIHGWEFGDSLLRVIGDAVSEFVAEQGGIAGRSEADHFAIYCPHLDSYDDLFDRVQKKITAFSPSSGIWLRMGVMPWEADLETRQQIEQALIACSLARGRYSEHIVVFDRRVRERESFEQRLKNDLGTAVSNGEFAVYYQPKFDIRGDAPVLDSAEALVRWNHPEFGMIYPDEFVPLFENSGQIGTVDRFVWEETASQIAEWKKQYGVPVVISINLSRIDIYDPHLEERLDKLIESNELDPSELRLEITESAYTENSDEIVSVMTRLQKKGYKVEMDDFGAGYSSFNLLSSLPIDALKMDRTFIRNLGREERDTQIVKVILDIAKNLNIPLIAEGVETEQQLDQLKKLGCDIVQGFYFSRPLTAAEFEDKYLASAE